MAVGATKTRDLGVVERLEDRLAEALAEVKRLQADDEMREAAFQCYAEQEKKDRAEIERLKTENKSILRAVLFHFGPSGANKVCTSVLDAREPKP